MYLRFQTILDAHDVDTSNFLFILMWIDEIFFFKSPYIFN